MSVFIEAEQVSDSCLNINGVKYYSEAYLKKVSKGMYEKGLRDLKLKSITVTREDRYKKLLSSNMFKIICETVTSRYGLSIEEVRDKSRVSELVRCRQLIFYFSHKYLSNFFAMTSVAKHLNRHHASGIHAVRKIEKEVSIYKFIKTEIDEMDEEIARTIREL